MAAGLAGHVGRQERAADGRGCYRRTVVLRRLLALPAVHFVAIGAVLYAAQYLAGDGGRPAVGDAATRTIVVDARTLDDLRDGFHRTSGRAATAEEVRALVRDFADQEILYREARVRGLGRDDRSVKWRLVQKLRFLEGREDENPEALYREALALGLDRDDVIIRRLLIEKMRLLIQLGVSRKRPDDAELRDYYLGIAEEFRQPARISLAHLFLSGDKRGDSLAADAAALQAHLPTDAASLDDALLAGDVFPFGHHLRASSQANLAKLLGPDFAGAVIDLPVGGWYGPVRSAYGLHFVWIEARRESEIPEFGAVREQVFQRYAAAMREAELATAMERLRKDYSVIIDDRTGSGP